MQWLASSRVIERMGVFATAMTLPGMIGILGAVSMAIAPTGWVLGLFISIVALKFLRRVAALHPVCQFRVRFCFSLFPTAFAVTFSRLCGALPSRCLQA